MTSDNMRIFITSCIPMWRAEKALEYSIMKYCTEPYEVVFLRSGEPSILGRDWRTNVDLGIDYNDKAAIKKAGVWNVGRNHPTCYSGQGWATPFSCFRFTIPELCGFTGRAIHMDVDFLVLRDLREVFEFGEMTSPMMGPANCRTDMMLIDCEAFANKDWWPSIDEMKPSGKHIERDYKRLLATKDYRSSSPVFWESWDGKCLCEQTYTIHYTNMNTQPWKPLPGMFEYPPHPHKEATYLFWEHYAEALEAEARGEIKLQGYDPLGADTPLKAARERLALSQT